MQASNRPTSPGNRRPAVRRKGTRTALPATGKHPARAWLQRGATLLSAGHDTGATAHTLSTWERRIFTLRVRLRQSVLRGLGLLPNGPSVHTELATSQNRCSLLEAELRRTHSDLACLRAELAGTRAGERRAHHLALHDGLTGLPNRRYFLSRLNQVLSGTSARPTNPCVLYLDLDGFKGVNDLYGHQTGDELLRVVAGRLAQSVRAGDMVARLGGDEFACLLEQALPREQLLQLAHKLHDSVAAPMTLGAHTLVIQPSIGLARCPDDGCTAEKLLARADAAMYHAKQHHSQVACASEPGG